MIPFLGKLTINKKALREGIANCRVGIENRDRAIAGYQVSNAHLHSEVRKLKSRERALMAKIKKYETEIDSAREFLLEASDKLTQAYNAPITDEAETHDDDGY